MTQPARQGRSLLELERLLYLDTARGSRGGPLLLSSKSWHLSCYHPTHLAPTQGIKDASVVSALLPTLLLPPPAFLLPPPPLLHPPLLLPPGPGRLLPQHGHEELLAIRSQSARSRKFLPRWQGARQASTVCRVPPWPAGGHTGLSHYFSIPHVPVGRAVQQLLPTRLRGQTLGQGKASGAR